jgi:saccharopine dehydrogenase-like NADP-dependent oxidoreductase
VFEAYPNRDSIAYMRTFGLDHLHTMIRATLRYPGWSEVWAQIVRLGLPNESLRIPDLGERSYRDVVEMFLPMTGVGERIEERTARFLDISPTGRIMEVLTWLGLFSDEKIGCAGETPAAMLVHLLEKKLPLLPGMRDMVIIMHELDVDYPEGQQGKERITSTLVAEGEGNGFTAMAKTVGLPTAIGAKLLLAGEIQVSGSQIPTHPSIYEPVLREIAEEGLVFRERAEPLV